jgi:O-antigen ligase/tetratricopeptide (TPR) repeat protein
MRQNPSFVRANPAAALLLASIVLAPLVFARWTLEAFVYNKAVLLQATALTLLALAGPARIWNLLRSAIRDPAAAGAMLFALSAIASTATSVSPRVSLQGTPESVAGLGVVLAYVVVFFAARALLGSTAGVLSVASAATIGAAGAGAYALLQIVGLEPMAWDGASEIGAYVRPFATFGHANLLGGYLAMALPLLLLLAARARSRAEKGPLAVLLVATAVAVVGVIASLSRAAWLAAACGLAVTVAGQLRVRWRIVFVPVLALAVATAVLVTAGGSAITTGLGTRVHSIADGGGRFQIWRTAWLLFTDHPWLGSGLDTLQLVFGSRQTADYWRVEWGKTPSRAHNELLHTLATQGLCGALALLVWATGLAIAAVRAWRRATPEDRPVRAAVAGALVAFVVQVQFGFAEPGCGTLAACLAGMLAGLVTGSETVGKLSAWPVAAGAGFATLIFAANAVAGMGAFGPKHALAILVFASAVFASVFAVTGVRTPPLTSSAAATQTNASPFPGSWLLRTGWAALALGVAVFGLIRPYIADCASQAGEAAQDVDFAVCLQDHQTAVQLAPERALHWTRLAAAMKEAADSEPAPSARLRWLRLALDAIDRALSLVPIDPANHANRGRVLAGLSALGVGDAAAALAEFDAASARSPYDLLYRADAGQAALDCGLPERAREYFEGGRMLDRDFARFACGLGAVALKEGKPTEALSWLERTNDLKWYGDSGGASRVPALMAAAHLAARHSTDAEHWARQALELHPEDTVPHWVLAAALELEGHKVEAVSEYRALLGIAPGWKPAREALRRLGEVSP